MLETKTIKLEYDDFLETILDSIENMLSGDYDISRRAVGLLLLQGDRDIEQEVMKKDDAAYTSIQEIITRARFNYNQPLSYIIALQRQKEARRILSKVVTTTEMPVKVFAERLSRAMMNPFIGTIILLIVLYFGLYQFVGVFGAGTLVGFIEGTVFGEWINPWVSNWITSIIPLEMFQDLFVGDYGIITLGLTYTFALILPIVGTFFIVFSIGSYKSTISGGWCIKSLTLITLYNSVLNMACRTSSSKITPRKSPSSAVTGKTFRFDFAMSSTNAPRVCSGCKTLKLVSTNPLMSIFFNIRLSRSCVGTQRPLV